MTEDLPPPGTGAIDGWPVADRRPAETSPHLGEADPPAARRPSMAGAFGEDPLARILARAVDGRLARIHLRGGLLTLARASLEQMAGVGALDREALADLAEARWRSGDLEGAAEAATAHLAAGGDEPLAHLIVAEESDRQGSLVDARRHAAIVRERVGVGLDRLFAGEPRSTAWPLEGVDWMDEGASGPGRWGLLAGGAEVARPEPGSWRLAPPPAAGSPVSRSRTRPRPAVRTALTITLERDALGRELRAELDRAEAELAEGDVAQGAYRLALALRAEPSLSASVLALADAALGSGGAGAALAALHLVRGDAHRGLGEGEQAEEAYREARRALGAPISIKESL